MSAVLDRLFGSAVDALKVVADLESRGVGLHILDLGGDMASEGRMAQLVTFASAFKEDGKLSKQQAIALMVEMKADGKSLRAIAAAVAGQGYKITHSGVARILKAHKYDVWKVEKLRAQAEEAEAEAGPPATPYDHDDGGVTKATTGGLSAT